MISGRPVRGTYARVEEELMRTMLKVSMQVEAANKAIKEGLVPKLVQETTEAIKPEATYFTADDGMRTAYFFFELKDASQIPAVCEPWFNATNAKIELKPVMNPAELKAGLEKAFRK
jgi:hypothetical protein